MGAARVFDIAGKLSAAIGIVLMAVMLVGPVSAADNPMLPPAPYKSLPVGTEIEYDRAVYVVTEQDGLTTVFRIRSGGAQSWRRTYAVFGETGTDLYVEYASGEPIEYTFDAGGREKLERLWPLAVGKETTFRLNEAASGYGVGAQVWTITLKVTGVADIETGGTTYRTYVVDENAKSDRGMSFVGRKWYDPQTGVIVRATRTGTGVNSIGNNYGKTAILAKDHDASLSLRRVTFPPGAAPVASSPPPAVAAVPAVRGAAYRPLPVGTEVTYDAWAYRVERSEGYSTVVKTKKGQWVKSYAVFGREGAGRYTLRSMSGIRGRGSVFALETDFGAGNKAKLAGLWPLRVGNKTEFDFEETGTSTDGIDGRTWHLTVEVVGTEPLQLGGFLYPTYVVHAHASSAEVAGQWKSLPEADYSETFWYHPDSGLVLKFARKWLRGDVEEPEDPRLLADAYSLIDVSFPAGATGNVLTRTPATPAAVAATAPPVEAAAPPPAAAPQSASADAGAAAEREREAEMARLKFEVERAKREAEIARLKLEAERARKEAEAARLAPPASDPAADEERLWRMIATATTAAPLEDYLARYPNGRFRNDAQARLAVVKLRAAVAGVEFGNYYGLVIGIDDYKHLPKLNTAVNDAKAVADVLQGGYGFQVKLLLNADRAQLIDALDLFRETLGPKDNLLIYYAGHGWLDREVDRGYWLPADAEKNRRRDWVSNATITDALKAIGAKHVMVVADSCYSGTLVRGVDMGARARTGDYWTQMAKKWARVAITSGGLEPVVDKGGGGHSPFAKAFIAALNENASVMDGTTLFSMLRRPVMLAGRQTPQYADVREAGHDGGDFLFVRRK